MESSKEEGGLSSRALTDIAKMSKARVQVSIEIVFFFILAQNPFSIPLLPGPCVRIHNTSINIFICVNRLLFTLNPINGLPSHSNALSLSCSLRFVYNEIQFVVAKMR